MTPADVIEKVRNKIRITKIVRTRSLKGQNGDNFVGFSSAWDTIQDDTGGGGDLINTSSDEDIKNAFNSGLTLEESVLADLVLAQHTELQAYRVAFLGGNIQRDVMDNAIASVQAKFSILINKQAENIASKVNQ